MSLSSELISQFAKITNDKTEVKQESTHYGTTVEYDGSMYVQLDGSDLLTPISTTADTKAGERVMVLIKNHTATITGNLSSPAARTGTVTELDGKVTNLGSQISEFEVIIADKVDTVVLQAVVGRVDQLTSDNVIIKEHLDANTADIDSLEADNVVINEKLTAAEGDIKKLNTEKLSAEEAEIKFANIDFSNIGTAAIEEFLAKSGLIDDLTVGDGIVTGKLVGVTIIGDLIEGGTIKADKLVVKGTDGIYYKLNFEGGNFAEGEAVPDDSLHGSIITAKSITAEKVSVKDLVAFGATIGGFKITDNAIHSIAKTSATNATRGLYMDNEGQMSFGDTTRYLKYYKDQNGVWHLEIAADDILFGADGESVDTVLRGVTADVDEVKAKAEKAQSDAEAAQSYAERAQTRADEAATAATNAQTAADDAKTRAEKAQTDLATAQQNLENVESRLDTAETDLAAAQEAANAAQSTADTAKANAATAQSTADTAKANAATAQSTADTAKANAATAQSAAQAAQTAADEADAKAAQAQADLETAQQNLTNVTNRVGVTEEEIATAKQAVETAQSAADKAQSDANAAQTAANNAADAAATAQSTANAANTNATNAQAAANAAQSAADAAQAAADKADADLTKAKEDLAEVTNRVGATEEEIAAAQEAVNQAQLTANTAKSNAEKAQSTADTAKSQAEQAQIDADNAQSSANAAQDAADKAQADVNALATRVTNAETAISQNSEAIELRATKTEVDTALTSVNSRVDKAVKEHHRYYLSQEASSGSDTLTWDGNTEGLVSCTNAPFYKVSDAIPTRANCANGITVSLGGGEIPVDGESAQGAFMEDGAASFDCVVIIPCDNYDAGGMVFPKAGVYFSNDGDGYYVQSLTIPGYTGFGTDTPTPEKPTEFPPESAGSDTLIWDGNTEGLVYVDPFGDGSTLLMTKVSDVILTKEDMANGYIATWSSGIVDNNSRPETISAIQGSFNADGFSVCGGHFVVCPQANYVDDGLEFPEAGLYLVNSGGDYISSLTIPGYTGFGGATWTETEPEYVSGNDVYTVSCDVYIDDTFSYSEVSKMSSYDGVKSMFETIMEAKSDLALAEQNLANVEARVGTTEEELKSAQREVANAQAAVDAAMEDLLTTKQTIAELKVQAEDVSIEVTKIVNYGVDKVTTKTGYTFGEDGLKIQKDGQEIVNTLDHEGMSVKRGEEVMLKADKDGVIATDVKVRNYLIIGKHARFEDYNDGTDSKRTACFWVDL